MTATENIKLSLGYEQEDNILETIDRNKENINKSIDNINNLLVVLIANTDKFVAVIQNDLTLLFDRISHYIKKGEEYIGVNIDRIKLPDKWINDDTYSSIKNRVDIVDIYQVIVSLTWIVIACYVLFSICAVVWFIRETAWWLGSEKEDVLL